MLVSSTEEVTRQAPFNPEMVMNGSHLIVARASGIFAEIETVIVLSAHGQGVD
jgi:hypothetical protein